MRIKMKGNENQQMIIKYTFIHYSKLQQNSKSHKSTPERQPNPFKRFYVFLHFSWKIQLPKNEHYLATHFDKITNPFQTFN